MDHPINCVKNDNLEPVTANVFIFYILGILLAISTNRLPQVGSIE